MKNSQKKLSSTHDNTAKLVGFSRRQVLVLYRLLRSPATVKQLRLCRANNIPDVISRLRRKNIHIDMVRKQGSIGSKPHGVYSLSDESKRLVRALLGGAK